MKRAALSLLLLPLAFCLAASGRAAAQNELGPDSRPQPGVPKGEVLKFSFERSRIFPGTYRDYWIYVPAQYTPDKPACLYVNQDGIQWQAPTVFDNLIQKKEMPVTIGVFVMHGRVRAADGEKALDRFNRSLEYDGLGDRYARFLVEELLPEVETKKTSDGRAIRLSRNPNDRAIGGSSSGAVCAFTAAWERPDQFSRVFSAIGTYVGLRGADRYPTLLRKYEPKPLRIFLQDGSSDLNIYAGDWWMANQMMERALVFAGYEVEHSWGEGGHSGNHGTAIFPDAMRWLWKGWPEPVKAGRSRNNTLSRILLPSEDWQAAEGPAPGPLAAGRGGEVRLDNGAKNGKTVARAFGPDGRLYTAGADGRIAVAGTSGKATQLADGIRAGHLVVSSSGALYATEPARGRVWLVDSSGKKQVVDEGLRRPTGVTLSPDQTLLYVADAASHWVYSYQVQPDGTVRHKQQYYWLHIPDDRDESEAGGMCVDREGRLYVATNLGIQVCDQPGRVNCILPVPGGAVSAIVLGGPNGDTLHAVAGGKLYRRKLGAKGAYAWDTPNKPPVPGL